MADAFTKHLADLGLTAIALPNGVFGPLSLIYEWHGRRGWSNDFGALVQNGVGSPPPVSSPAAFPDLSGKVVRSSDVKGGLSILSGLIGALGGGTLGIKGGFENASTIEFQYSSVTMVEVSAVGLENFIASGSPPSSDTLLGRYLGDHLFVAARVLRSREFLISAQQSSGQSIALDVPVLQQAVGANVAVEKKDASSFKIGFKGDQDVSFAFVPYWIRLKTRGGKSTMYLQPTKPGGVSTTQVAMLSGKGAALNLENSNIGLA